MQSPTPEPSEVAFSASPVVISSKGKSTPTGYAGYAIITISSSLESGFLNYTVDGSAVSCNPTATAPPTTFLLNGTAQVWCTNLMIKIHSYTHPEFSRLVFKTRSRLANFVKLILSNH